MPSILLSDNGVGSGSAGIKTTGGSDGVLALQTTTSGGTATTAVTIDTAQNVGVGVTPSAWTIGKVLQIGTSVGSGFLYGGGAGSTTWYGVNNYYGSGGYTYATSYYATQYRQDPSTGQHQWFNAPSGTAGNTITFTQAMTLDASSNLLLNQTTNPANGKLALSFAAGAFGFASNFTTGSGTAYFQAFNYNGGGVGNISSTGTTTVYATSSDYRLKNTVEPMTGALAKVTALKPVTYKWNANNSDGEGFIAHELAEVCPDAVVGDKDAVDADGNPVYQSIDASFLVATLTAAIQEQQALITTLTERISALEAK